MDAVYGAGFKDKLKAALLAIDDPAILGQFARSKFIPAKNSDYAPVEEILWQILLQRDFTHPSKQH